MIQFPINDLSQIDSISIPFSYTMSHTGEEYTALLHCYPPSRPDPIAPHEHQWQPATCVSPKICTVCRRYEGEYGDHEYWPSEDENYFACTQCGITLMRFKLGVHSGSIEPGHASNLTVILKHRLRELGYYSGPFHARYDDILTQAVLAFQTDNGLIPDGVCHPETIEKLFP